MILFKSNVQDEFCTSNEKPFVVNSYEENKPNKVYLLEQNNIMQH